MKVRVVPKVLSYTQHFVQ